MTQTFPAPDDLEFDDESEENNTEESPVVVGRRATKSNDPSSQPIDNAGDVPLFSDADKRGLRSISYIEVIKVDQPNNGYKGQLPTNATIQTVYELYGNGIFNFIACNHKKQKIRESTGVRISIPEIENEKAERKLVPSGQDENLVTRTLIQSQHLKHKDDLDRTERLATQASKDAVTQAQSYVQLVQTTTEAGALRDREHMKAVNDTQTSFMTNMFQIQQQGFQQMMAMLTAGHAQTMQIILATTKDKKDPMEMLLAGMRLAKDMGGDDDQPDWLKALDKGMSGLGHLVSLAKASPPSGPVMQIPGVPQNKELAVTSTKPVKGKPTIKNPNNTKLTLSEVEKILALKAQLDSKGIDFEDLLTDTIRADLQPHQESESSVISEESEEDLDTSDESASNMEGG